jgi:phosphoribosylformimino-5-aminoimidazole carboxamide ribotide isomerase
MKIIPVIDVLNGIAVHGIRGERKHYQPLKSLLCNSVDPLEIASAFESLSFNSLYIADLDAIQGKPANYKIYRNIISETGLELMIDTGISDTTKAETVLKTGVQKIVIGSETLNELDFVTQAIKDFAAEKVVVSIDLNQGKLLSKSESIASLDAVSFLNQLSDLGACQFILLELDRVGTEHGTNFSLMKNIMEQTEVELMVGGGIHSLQELEELRALGVSGALIATVLHNGKLSVDELKSAGFL